MEGETAEAAVRSVARLHAFFWGETKSTAAVEDIGLAAQGTYWYLDTRPDEYDSMDGRRGISGKLKKAARGIDAALKEHEYQTICHGDLKACNMSMSNDPQCVTLVDFQYMGRACPTKDLAYLFVCGMDVGSDFEERREDELLELYIDELASNGVGDDEDAPLPTLETLRDAL
jgi:thiamine kinase-like enzyme